MSEVSQTVETATDKLLSIAYVGDVKSVQRYLIEGADPNAFEETTGLTALHIAIGRNHLDLVKCLLDNGAKIVPDQNGRWPSTIAELCEVDGPICDLIADAEAAIDDGSP